MLLGGRGVMFELRPVLKLLVPVQEKALRGGRGVKKWHIERMPRGGHIQGSFCPEEAGSGGRWTKSPQQGEGGH